MPECLRLLADARKSGQVAQVSDDRKLRSICGAIDASATAKYCNAQFAILSGARLSLFTPERGAAAMPKRPQSMMPLTRRDGGAVAFQDRDAQLTPRRAFANIFGMRFRASRHRFHVRRFHFPYRMGPRHAITRDFAGQSCRSRDASIIFLGALPQFFFATFIFIKTFQR